VQRAIAAGPAPGEEVVLAPADGSQAAGPATLPDEDAMIPVVKESAFDRAGRNDPCPCGSGKKFKFCHGK
jgi:uncharacterized protein YecA (UPF0149 family)